jgi:DNA-binding beta-propeller fold protein YncE
MVKGVSIAAASIAVGLLLTACGAKPAREAFTAYVVNEGPGTVTPFSTLTGRVFKAIKVGNFPQAIAITPDGKTAYVLNQGSVTPVDLATSIPGKKIKPVNRGYWPTAIAISPDGTTAYATATFESTSTVESDMPGPMTPIHTATGTRGKPMQPGNNPQAIAITPDGTIAYVVNWQGPGTVTPVRTANGTHEKPIKVGSHPIAIALAPG